MLEDSTGFSLRKNVQHFNDINYNFNVLQWLLNGHLDGGNLNVDSISTGHLQVGSVGTDELEDGAVTDDKFDVELGDMAYENAVEKAKLGTTIIEGGYLKTGFVDADRVDTGTLHADRIGVGTITDDKVDETQWKYADEGDLGEMSYEDAVEKAKLGTTILEGGYLKTGFVDADRVDTGTLHANRIGANTITAGKIASGEIESQHISADLIWANNIDTNYDVRVGRNLVLQIDDRYDGIELRQDGTLIGGLGAQSITPRRVEVFGVEGTVLGSGGSLTEILGSTIWMLDDTVFHDDVNISGDLDVDSNVQIDGNVNVFGNIETDSYILGDDGRYATLGKDRGTRYEMQVVNDDYLEIFKNGTVVGWVSLNT